MTGNTRLRVNFAMVAVVFFGALILAAVPAWRPAIAAGPPPHSASLGGQQEDNAEEKLTPSQKMQRRFPQPVWVGHLIGLPVLDGDDSTIGYVRQVVRSPDGKISLIVPYSAWFGWARTAWGKRDVAVPIEVVALLALQINVLEMTRDDFDAASTWTTASGHPVEPDEKTLIALGRR